MSATQMDMLWMAYGKAGAVGSIRHEDDLFHVVMADRREIGAYPTLEIAKGALISHLKPGADRPEFRRV